MPKDQRFLEAFKELEDSYNLVQEAEDPDNLLVALKALRADAMWIENIIRAQKREDAGVPDPPRRKKRRLMPSSRRHKKKLPRGPKPKQLGPKKP